MVFRSVFNLAFLLASSAALKSGPAMFSLLHLRVPRNFMASSSTAQVGALFTRLSVSCRGQDICLGRMAHVEEMSNGWTYARDDAYGVMRATSVCRAMRIGVRASAKYEGMSLHVSDLVVVKTPARRGGSAALSPFLAQPRLPSHAHRAVGYVRTGGLPPSEDPRLVRWLRGSGSNSAWISFLDCLRTGRELFKGL